MASLITGYEYDIFISYRQKDNKYDGWVTEFVDHLKKELEATFKEEISVYFDINPHDGLLEIHDVDASLKDKLKCLVFIPIISRTYCDPKSFAWEHEFKAFVELASQDQFGLKVKLPNGNVASRVLPVSIHDLDIDDIKLCESIIGGVLRGVEFIYKEPGVNRPLRAKEDKPQGNLNNTIYRNQINKVALGIREVIRAIKQESHQDRVIIEKGISSVKTKRPAYFIWKKIYVISLLLLLAGMFAYITFRALNSRYIKRQIYTQTIPRVNILYDSALIEGFAGNKCWEAFKMNSEAEKRIPGDTNLLSLKSKLTKIVSIYSDPPGAEVFGEPYSSSDTSWHYFGTTPLLNVNIPLGASILRVVKNGHFDQNDAFFVYSWDNQYDTLVYKLLQKDQINENVVLISGRTVKPNLNGISYLEPQWIGDFKIDKSEVTNEDFKKFIDDGGYMTPKYWKRKFVKDGVQLSWDKAMLLFRDQSGWQGPSGWISGQFPTGESRKPVSGISWYEAAAYAEYCGKSLPTIYHWCAVISPQLIPIQVKNSNFDNHLIAQVGTYKGISRYGLYDIIGNVREWIHNQINNKNYVFGGSVNDPVYSSSQAYSSDPWERDGMTGFRCIKYLDDTNKNVVERAFNYEIPDKSADKPVSNEMFRILTKQFEYDKKPINIIKSSLEDFNGWRHEIVTIEAGYEGPDLGINIYFPKNIDPPFQSVIIFPGDDAIINIPQRINEYPLIHEFLLRSGRVIIMPQYFNTYGRGNNFNFSETYLEFKESLIKRVNDLRRTIDYLESRIDIDTARIAYLGVSWGSFHAPYILAVERRIKLSIVNAFGLSGNNSYPELYHINYLPHIKIPMLLLSGKYDFDWNYETQRLYVEWLGTSVNDKKWVAYESVHGVPIIEAQKESLPWLDKYFGNPLNR